MKDYDVIVIGSGCGMIVVNEALARGLRVALVDKGPPGGTCLNLGCVPSKMLIASADRIIEIQDSGKLGVSAAIKDIDFRFIMGRMRDAVSFSQKQVKDQLLKTGIDFYEGTGSFMDPHTLEVNSESIQGKRIFIAAGARPSIPHIPGLEDINYLTSDNLLQLDEKPESLLIVGGSYIATEYGHFFAAIGTKVTIVEMADRLLTGEDPEISAALKNELGKRLEIRTGATITRLKQNGKLASAVASDRVTGAEIELSAEKVLVATGREPNSDLLKPEKGGIQTDKRGFILVNEYLETTRSNIYAIGDINGKQMFTHMANRQARLVSRNAFHGEWLKMDFSITPHAVFSCPQIASVGLTEPEARQDKKVLVGKARYYEQAMGMAMDEKSGFAKAIVEKDSGRILGFHIIGLQAPTLIQEVCNATAEAGTADDIRSKVHIHPALSEIVASVFNNLRE